MVDPNRLPSTAPPPVSGDARLNIFALPTRTTLLFGLIVLVVMLPILAAMVEDTPLWEPFILMAMIILPLRSFLRRPQVEIRQKGLVEPGPQYARLAAHIERLRKQVGLRRKLRLLLSPKTTNELYTRGTFTRRYLIISPEQADQLQGALESPNSNKRAGAEAILLHEFSHFANQDVVPTFFSRSLLGVTIAFMFLNMFSDLLIPFFYNVSIRFFDFKTLWPAEVFDMLQAVDPEMAEIVLDPPLIDPKTWLKYEIYIFTVFWPLIVGALALLFFFWPALLRTRELYADARAAQWQGTAHFIQAELLREATRISMQPASAKPGLLNRLRQPLAFFAQTKKTGLLKWLKLFSARPDLNTRRACLVAPEKIYGSNVAIAATAGFTVLFLNLTLGSLLISRYIRGPNATLPFVLGFTIISLSLLPTLCSSTGLSSVYQKIWRIVFLFTGIKLVPQYLAALLVVGVVVVDPEIIDLAAYTLVGAFGPDLPSLDVPLPLFLYLYVIGPAILFTFIMPVTLIAFLRLDSYLKRQILTWYGLPILKKHPVVFLWGLTVWLAFVLWFVVLPFYNVAAAPTAHTLLDVWIIGRMAIISLMSVAIGAALVYAHRRYARRCPHCHSFIPNDFRPGKRCSTCGLLLHTWLLASK